MNKFNKQKAIILYLAVVITAIMLAIALGVSTILFGQIRTIKEMGYSVNALYFADSGIEYVLYRAFKEGVVTIDDLAASYTGSSPCDYPSSTDKEAEIIVLVGGTGGCSEDYNYCIQSKGIYQGVRRAIEIGF